MTNNYVQKISEGQIQKHDIIDQKVGDVLPKIVYDGEAPHDDSLKVFDELGMD